MASGRGADLAYVDFRGSDLVDVDLTDADLMGAVGDHEMFRRVSFDRSKGLKLVV